MKMNQISKMFLSLTMLAAMAGCNVQTKATDSSSAQVETETAGGWEWNQMNTSLDKNADVKKAFENAMKDLVGVDYEPIAYLARQLVSGSNYCILCRSTSVYPNAKPSYSLVYIYEDLEGNAQMISAAAISSLSDGWSINEEDASIGQHEEVKKAFESAIDGLSGAEYGAVAYLAQKENEGTDYLILCRVTPVTLNAESSYVLVTVHVDTNGDAGISETKDIDLSADSESETEIANPYTEVETLEEAAKLTGFTFTVAEADEEHPDMVIRVLDDYMIEVIYVNNENETEEGLDEAYRIRKAEGSDDISGDYNEYAFSKTVESDDMSISIKGNGNSCYVATWQKDGYTYALDVDGEYQMSESEMLSIIESVN